MKRDTRRGLDDDMEKIADAELEADAWPDMENALEAEAWRVASYGANHPDYLSDLEDTKRDRDDLASSTQTILVHQGIKEDTIQVCTTHPKQRAKNRTYAMLLGEHLDAPVQFVAKPQAGDSPELPQDKWKGPPAHVAVKDPIATRKYLHDNCPYCAADRARIGYGGWVYRGDLTLVSCPVCNIGGRRPRR